MIDEGQYAHEILGLPPHASSNEVREAYLRLARAYHPDTHPDDLVAERRFKRVTGAYIELKNSFYFRGSAAYRPPNFWSSYRQILVIASFFVLTPLAILFLTRSGEQAVPAPEISQAKGTGALGIVDSSVNSLAEDKKAEAEEKKAEHAADFSAPEEISSAIKTDGLTKNSPAKLPEAVSYGAPSPGVGRGPIETPLPWWARVPSSQLGHGEAAAAAPKTFSQTRSEPGPEQQTQLHLNKAAVDRAGKKPVLPLKTVNAAEISILSKEQKTKPEAPIQSASRAFLEHSLDRAVLSAAPGG